MKFQTTIDGKELTFEIQKRRGRIFLQLNSTTEEWEYIRLTPHSYSILTHGKSHYLTITEQSDGYKVVIDQCTYGVKIKDESDLLLEKFGYKDPATDSLGEIRAPIPGLISAIFVETGQKIKEGDRLMILEAMKMENEIISSLSGIIEDVAITQGQSVEKGALLISIVKENNGNR